MVYKFGRRPARLDARTLKLEKYLLPTLPPLPEACDQGAAVHQPWGMLGNDAVGDCTCAAAAHLLEEWTANLGAEITLTDQQVLDFYSALSGYRPDDPNSDTGLDGLTTLNGWRTVGLAGHKLDAYASLEPPAADCTAAEREAWHQRVQAAVYLFGGVWLGVNLPEIIVSGAEDPLQLPWDDSGDGQGEWAPSPAGGHAVCLVAYNQAGLTCVTWGQEKQLTWGWLDRYCDPSPETGGEAYACLDAGDQLQAGRNWEGFDAATLQADLGLI
jgi:hypothetical protein